MNIPLVDLYAQYRSIKSEIDEAIRAVVDDTAFIGGAAVSDFERAFSKAHGANRCVGLANGTDAIFITLKMLGIGAGDEVITTAHSWISTSEAITATGATPVFVDVDEYYTMDPQHVDDSITARTRAVLPVHLYGQSADMTAIMEIARERNLIVVEDCAQAHLATWQGRMVGTFGHAGTFSFYPGKNLGAYGDAGGVITEDIELEARIRMYANHGQLRKHDHEMEGVNSRLDGLQAAILLAKLPHLAEWTKRRQMIASWYSDLMEDIPQIETPRVRPGATHSYHLYVVQTDGRAALAQYLKGCGIQTGLHYPVMLPFLKVYSENRSARSPFPVARRNQNRILSLPIFPEMTREQVEFVVTAIRNWCRKGP